MTNEKDSIYVELVCTLLRCANWNYQLRGNNIKRNEMDVFILELKEKSPYP